jgi:hypothetical protein
MHDIMAVFKECFMNDSSPSDTVVLGLKHDMWQREYVIKNSLKKNWTHFVVAAPYILSPKNIQ